MGRLEKFLSRFPLNNPNLLKRWVITMKRAEWQPTKYSVLCEKHFTPDHYVNMGVQDQTNKYLKTDAVRSIFNFPPHPGADLKYVKQVARRSENYLTQNIFRASF